MNLRQPTRAGSFYEESTSSCRRHATLLLEEADLPDDLPRQLYGGIVPHAGWVYSGKQAAMTFKALLSDDRIDTVVLLGADHCGTVHVGEVFDSGVWRTPLGDVKVNQELAGALLRAGGELFRANPQAHAFEHSLEVQIPFLQAIRETLRIVPVGVPPTALAVEIGNVIGHVLKKQFSNAVVVGSSDLTHHGGHFPAPGGRGKVGVEWTEKNDRRMIDLIESMQAGKIVTEAQQHENACGAGAIAAAVAAAGQLGAKHGRCLSYTNSYRVIRETYPGETDDTTVGYASIVFG